MACNFFFFFLSIFKIINIQVNRTLPSFPEHKIAVKHAIDHRCGVRVRGPNLTDSITGTDPLKDG